MCVLHPWCSLKRREFPVLHSFAWRFCNESIWRSYLHTLSYNVCANKQISLSILSLAMLVVLNNSRAILYACVWNNILLSNELLKAKRRGRGLCVIFGHDTLLYIYSSTLKRRAFVDAFAHYEMHLVWSTYGLYYHHQHILFKTSSKLISSSQREGESFFSWIICLWRCDFLKGLGEENTMQQYTAKVII
jgi:hypothetical protein